MRALRLFYVGIHTAAAHAHGFITCTNFFEGELAKPFSVSKRRM